MDKLGINLGYFLFQVINFIILIILLYAWAYKPVLRMMATRKEKIAQGIEDARVAAEARANAEKEAARIIAEAQAKAAQVVNEASDKAEKAVLEIRAEADADIAKDREGSIVEIEQERDRILGELRGQVAALAIAAAQKLIGENLDEKRQHALLDEFFSGVKSGRVVLLEGTTIAGASADVTSALPLTSAEQDIVKKDILSRIGPQATVTFRTDPSILGGLVIRAGGKVIDASVTGQLQTLRQNLS